MNPIRRGSAILFVLMGISLLGMGVDAQVSVVDTLTLTPVPPDSVYLRREGGTMVVGWYPPVLARAQVTGSRNYTQWYVNNNPSISRVNVIGQYPGALDRTLQVHKSSASVAPDTIGVTKSIPMLAELVDRLGNRETYAKVFNLGTNFNTLVGDSITVPMLLVGQATGDTLKTGISISFKRGIIDNSVGPGLFTVDLQTFEGFNIWRGLTPYPSRDTLPDRSIMPHMEVIESLSRDDAAMGIPTDSIYFREWPKKDARGRDYYEFVDNGVYPGFTYFYNVTCFDKGYFLGKYLHNKVENFICDEYLDRGIAADPNDPVSCESVAKRVVMTVSTQKVMKNIYAVPNPYRTGTSAETTPFYHNYPDLSIKLFNVPEEADVKIYTLSGDLVFQTHHSSPDGSDGIVTWNVKNMRGQEVGSGIYILKVMGPAGHVYGRICVIR